jgi:hypothetical protein
MELMDNALHPAMCADGSLNRYTDPAPAGGFGQCRYCGHPGCFPGQPCTFCQFELRLQALETPSKGTP